MKSIENLARPNIISLTPYQSAKRLGYKGKILLNANEYPKSVKITLKQNNLNRYPDFQPKNVIKLYSTYSGLQKNQILVHRGADEGIELLMRTFCEPGKDAIMFFPPTYGMYKVSAESIGVKYYPISVNSKLQLNLSAISKKIKKVKLIYICNPNNPTANVFDHKDIYTLIKMVNNRAIIVIDEAYIEFCPQFSLVTWLNNYLNIVILRTMSKAFALAGIRCGFTLANEKIINLLLKVIAPYPLSSPVTDIAAKALNVKGITTMKNNIEKIISTRKWFIKALNSCLCVEKVFDSNTNFVLVRFKKAEAVFSFLQEKGIIVRNQSMHSILKKCIRITIGSIKECKVIISTLKFI